MRRALAGLAFVAVALAIPAAASAHATLEQVTPGFQQELKRSPRVVTLHFDQSVTLPYLEVLDENGKNHALASRARGLEVSARVKSLPAGAYTIRWHALSADSHVVSGVWTFGVRVKAPPPTEAYGASGPTTTENIVRWLYFTALAVLIGSLAFRFLVLRGLERPPAVEKRLFLLSLGGVIGVLEIGILAFCLRCEDVLQLPFGKFLYGDLSPIAEKTRFGTAFVVMTLAYAVVAALVYLGWLFDRERLLIPALLISICFAAGLSVSGHDGVDPGAWWLTQLADWVHLTAACLWVGGLLALVVAVWPVARSLRRVAFERFAQLALVLVAVVLIAGTYLSIERLPHFSDLWTTGYGQVLLFKIGLVCGVVAWGAAHHFFVRPRLATAGNGFLTRVGRSIVGEACVAVAVLLVAAVLTDSKPPPPAGVSGASSAIAR